MRRTLPLVLLAALPCLAVGQEEFRTDGGDGSLPWYQIQPGVFPPEGSAHYFAGELIQVNHAERRFVLRVDRTDAQRRSHWDLPVGVRMLPFGSVYYRGSPASLAHVPLGTHLHGLFYVKDPQSKREPIKGWHGRISNEADFTRCLRLEDDFSYHARQNQLWRVDQVDLSEKKLTATLQQDGQPVGQAKEFDLLESTRLWQGRSVVTLQQIKPGQKVLFNITWATLYGPGRIREIWLDEESRQLATTHQLARHKRHIRERGLPGWVDAVDNQKRIVTITLFDNVHPSLLEDVKQGHGASVAVAEENLLTYDPVNDHKSGPVLDVRDVAKQPGSSGMQIDVRVNLLLEGFRPTRIVRVYPAGWNVIALPKEEQLFGRR